MNENDLILKSVDYAIYLINEGESGEVFNPFVIYNDDIKMFADSLPGDNNGRSIERAKDFIKSLKDKADFAILCGDGFFETGGVKHDAVITEVYIKDRKEGESYATIYERKDGTDKVKTEGNVKLTKYIPNILM